MSNSWVRSLNKYNWEVDLRHFNGAESYPGYFNRIVKSIEVAKFENMFRISINDGSSFEIAGEVCFWKNYGNAQSRNKITLKLLSYLENKDNWDEFVRIIKEISFNPSYDNFMNLKSACNQPSGFATPITFLSFYNPNEYPMVDKHIANWWKRYKNDYGFGDSPDFSQRKDGWIKATTISDNKLNWNAYVAWKSFCCEYAKLITENCGLNWRARDIEMAVWEAQKNGTHLEILK